MGVRIVDTYRPAKKRSYEKGLHLEYLKRGSRWIFRNQKTTEVFGTDSRDEGGEWQSMSASAAAVLLGSCTEEAAAVLL